MTLNEFSPEEQAVMDELQTRTIDCVTPKMLEDNYLFFRFAKARNFDLAEAEAMLRKHACWRKKFSIDTILTDYEPPEVLVKYVPSCLMCFDTEGCIVRYTDCGRIDAKGLTLCAKNTDLLRYYVYRIEQDIEALLKRNKKLGKETFLQIFDLENLQYTTSTNMRVIHHCLYFVKTYIDNYPERLKYAIVINAPFYFLWSYAIIKQVIPATIVRKIRIYGTEGWKEELLKLIDADVLPAFLGGNRTDPGGNPDCNTIVKRGEPIPKSYFMENEKKKIDAAFKKLKIMPFSKEEISFEVKEENSNLEWEFEVKSRDIDFSVQFKRGTLESVELIPKERISTEYETEKGFFKCENIGTYTMVLDNSYSWIYPKEVCYKAEIKPPNYDKSVESL